MSSQPTPPFSDLDALATHFRGILENKKYVLLFAYNGTGKTRLSCAFKDLGKRPIPDSEEKSTDTLYYNAFTEDLFTWDNDLESDTERRLYLNRNSKFFNGIRELAMEVRIRKFLRRYADFDFNIDYDDWFVHFSREVRNDNATEIMDNIKVSRGEENIFVWCFFLAIIELVIDQEEAYSWVKYIYIDDPISSLDDNNVIAVASHLAQLMKEQEDLKIVISSHHALFFNVMYNELKKSKGKDFFLTKSKVTSEYIIQDTGDTPFFNHVALIKELKEAEKTGKLYTYHFNVLRNILEKAASFHGYKDFSECIKSGDDDPDEVTYARYVNILSHGNYSLFEPMEMVEDNKDAFKDILDRYMNLYRFNPDLFNEEAR
ncbi:AAA family ATPase [Oceanobacillus sp. ISL-73]|uniref:AAA family ATPase n=1 Tax=Oceanobacillus sp. ISL-73 TaxID=2819161 RepID=UPI001BE63B1C|nr:AAA family ATPase [Oceanobacillus sp. ISL-73]MBT2653234.1 AAA family ATPase [Oceanobacillus sp. ISL-73]